LKKIKSGGKKFVGRLLIAKSTQAHLIVLSAEYDIICLLSKKRSEQCRQKFW